MRLQLDPYVINPRRDSRDDFGRNGWYPYYAGYSARFAERLISGAKLPPGSLIADPWNGSGTTTWAANYSGLDSWGGDLNPVMKVVAKAKLLNSENCLAVSKLAEKIVESANWRSKCHSADPLLCWMSVSAASHLRSIELSIISHVFVDNDFGIDPDERASASEISSFLYLCLFLLARKCANTSKVSNPTWVASRQSDATRMSSKLIGEKFVTIARDLASQVETNSTSNPRIARARFDVSSSISLPLQEDSVDLILTSPPYCTRLDYAVATSVELAVLGKSDDLRYELRRKMMGTTTVPKVYPEAESAWGGSCNKFLGLVKNHQSRASSTYYHKSHLQYFSDLAKSIGEISRVIKPSGLVAIVVQDSFYKEIKNDLAKIVVEMAAIRSLSLVYEKNFEKKISFRSVNRGRAKYGVDNKPFESVLLLRPSN